MGGMWNVVVRELLLFVSVWWVGLSVVFVSLSSLWWMGFVVFVWWVGFVSLCGGWAGLSKKAHPPQHSKMTHPPQQRVKATAMDYDSSDSLPMLL